MARLFSLLGDSISTFSGCNPEGFRVYYEGERCAATGVRAPGDTWWAQVVDALGGKLLANGSFSGSLVEGSGFPAGCSPERIAALAPGGKAPDAVLVFIGINDYGWGGFDAQVAGHGNALPTDIDVDALGEPQVAALAAPGAAERFGSAYDAMLARMRAAYPDAEVWCCTLCPGRVAGRSGPTFAYCLRGVPFDRYNDAIREAARANGCRVADVRALGLDYEALDGTHPTALGMRQLAAMVERAMGEDGAGAVDPAGAAVPAAPDAASAWRSAEPCPRPSCIGCPDAASTGNQWLLVCERDG